MDEQAKYEKIAQVAAELDKIGSKATDELTYEEQEALEDYGQMMGQHGQQAALITSGNYKLARQRVRANPDLMQVLGEENLSVDDFLRLEQQRPEIFQQEIATGTRKYVQRLTGKASGEKGGDFFGTPTKRATPAQKAKLAEVRKKGKGNDDDIDAQLKIYGF